MQGKQTTVFAHILFLSFPIQNQYKQDTIIKVNKNIEEDLQIYQKMEKTKQDIKQGATQMKHDVEKKCQEGKKQVKDALNHQPTMLQSVTETLVQGWEGVKQVSQNIYEATTEKIHELTAPTTEQRVEHAKDDVKEFASDVKQGAKNLEHDAQKKFQQAKHNVKVAVGTQQPTVMENIKQKTAEGWEKTKQVASDAYNTTANKLSDAGNSIQKAGQDMKDNKK